MNLPRRYAIYEASGEFPDGLGTQRLRFRGGFACSHGGSDHVARVVFGQLDALGRVSRDRHGFCDVIVPPPLSFLHTPGRSTRWYPICASNTLFDFQNLPNMTEFVRRLVSGNKARFRDGDLNLELGAWTLVCRWLAVLIVGDRPRLYHGPGNRNGIPRNRRGRTLP
jgi:hypothetical protein